MNDSKNILPFSDPHAWSNWLKKNHASAKELWIQFYKKDSEIQSITYAEALDEALCWGWIDGHAKSHDKKSWIHRFTPRAPRSKWSTRNREHVSRLIRERRMQASGMAQVIAAKSDGRWDQAYSPPSESKVPNDFLEALKKFKKAETFFKTLNKANLYAINYRLQTAKKPETRAKRFGLILQMMKENKKFH